MLKFTPSIFRAALAGALTLVLVTGCETTQQKLMKQGLSEYKAPDYPAAQATFDKLLTYNQFAAEPNYYAGMTAFQQGKYETAAFHLKLAWQADPAYGEVKQALTETLIRQDKPDLALDFLDRDAELMAKTKDPRLLKTINKRRYVYQTEEYMYVRRADARAYLAGVYQRMGDYDNAAINYEKARDIAPNDPDVLFQIAEFYAKVGQKEKSADAYTKVYKIDPKYPGFSESLAKNNMVLK